jgi:hypothetical protein
VSATSGDRRALSERRGNGRMGLSGYTGDIVSEEPLSGMGGGLAACGVRGPTLPEKTPVSNLQRAIMHM